MKPITQLKSKQSVINRIYDIAGRHTKQIYNDGYWYGYNCIVRDLTAAGVEMDLTGAYYNGNDTQKTWEYDIKINSFSFKFRIFAHLPNGVLGQYDLTIILF